MATGDLAIERYVSVIKLNKGLFTRLPVILSGSSANMTIGGNLVVTGTITGGGGSTGATNVTATSANALSAGPAGTTNPSFNVDTSGGVTDVTGLNVNANAAGSGLALSTLSSGTNENLTIDAKGTGTVTINGTATGIVVLPAGTTIGGSVPLTSTITSSSANALVVGQNGATNPAFNIDASTATSATGLNIKSAAAAGGLAISVLSSGTNENLTINAKGSGTITLGGVSTGSVGVTNATATGFFVGPNGATNASFRVNTATASAATGFSIAGQAAAGGVNMSVISSGTNESGTISAKGTGTITINSTTALAAGGSAGAGVLISSTAGLGFYAGTGTPTFSAFNGSLYVNTTATTSATRLYVNNSGSGTSGTTWTAFTAAA